MKGFIKCPNGHWHKDDVEECPFCVTTAPNENRRYFSIEDLELVNYQNILTGYITLSLDNDKEVSFILGKGITTIGRKMDNQIAVSDCKMSSHHAKIQSRPDKFILRDNFSCHGTFVNDKNIGDDGYLLVDGDIIRMGETVFTFRTILRCTIPYDVEFSSKATDKNIGELKRFKKCPNGHYYKEEIAECPYCPKTTSNNNKTII